MLRMYSAHTISKTNTKQIHTTLIHSGYISWHPITTVHSIHITVRVYNVFIFISCTTLPIRIWIQQQRRERQQQQQQQQPQLQLQQHSESAAYVMACMPHPFQNGSALHVGSQERTTAHSGNGLFLVFDSLCIVVICDAHKQQRRFGRMSRVFFFNDGERYNQIFNKYCGPHLERTTKIHFDNYCHNFFFAQNYYCNGRFFLSVGKTAKI